MALDHLDHRPNLRKGEASQDNLVPEASWPFPSYARVWSEAKGYWEWIMEPLFPLGLTEIRRFGQGEENDLLAGEGADVMVQAPHLDAGDLLDHRFQDRPRRFDQVGPYLLEQVSAFLGWERLYQVLFRGRQNALKADHEEIIEQVGVNALGTPAHVVPLKATNSFTNGGFEFSPCFHSDTPRAATPGGWASLSENHRLPAKQEPSLRPLPTEY